MIEPETGFGIGPFTAKFAMKGEVAKIHASRLYVDGPALICS